MVVFGVDERGRHPSRDVGARARSHVIDPIVAVAEEGEVNAIGGGFVLPARLLDRKLAHAGREVVDVNVVVGLAVEVAIQLIGLVAEADGVALVRRERDRAHGVVGEADELLVGHAVLAQVAVVAVLRLFDDLLALQARVLVVPDDEVHAVAGVLRSAGPFLRRRLHWVDAEKHRGFIVAPGGVAVGADRHARREAAVGGGIVGYLGGEVGAGETEYAVALVLPSLVVRALEDGERGAGLVPAQAAIDGVIVAVECAAGAGLEIAQVHAVAASVLGADGVGEVAAVLVECELAHVAEVDFLAAGQIVEDEVAAARIRLGGIAIAAGAAPAARCPRAGGRSRRKLLEGDPGRVVAREGETAHAGKVGLGAGCQVHDAGVALNRFALALEAFAFGMAGIGKEGAEARVARECEVRSRASAAASAPAAGASAAGRFTERKGIALVGMGLAERHAAVSFERRLAVGEPRAVVGKGAARHPLPGHHVRNGERARSLLREETRRSGGRSQEQSGAYQLHGPEHSRTAPGALEPGGG